MLACLAKIVSLECDRIRGASFLGTSEPTETFLEGEALVSPTFAKDTALTVVPLTPTAATVFALFMSGLVLPLVEPVDSLRGELLASVALGDVMAPADDGESGLVTISVLA